MALAFLELDLSGISMDAPEPMTPARDVATKDDDVVLGSQTSPLADDGVVLAQPTITPPTPVSKTLKLTVARPLLTFLKSDVYCIYFKNFKNIVLSALLIFGFLYVNNFLYVFDMLHVVLFLLAFISICLWNCQLY